MLISIERSADERGPEASPAVVVDPHASIAGRVVDTSGAPLAGASVCVRTSLFEPESLGGLQTLRQVLAFVSGGAPAAAPAAAAPATAAPEPPP